MTTKAITVDKNTYDKFADLCRDYGINPAKKRNELFENFIMEYTQIGVFDRFKWVDFLDDNRHIRDKIMKKKSLDIRSILIVDPIKNEKDRPAFEMSGENIYDYILKEKG